jgi:protein-export membrane protein SecD/preprotein translocase SecF subunit
MRTASIRIRLVVIAAVVALSVWAIYPPDQKIKLGLDLKGGVHLVLRVKTDDALQRQTQATGTALNDLRRETVQQALSTIERRVNELGVAEPVVALYGDADRILVQLPGIEDVESAKQIIKSTAQLRLTLVERGPFPSRAAALLAYDNTLPAELEVLPERSLDLARNTSGESFYVVQRIPVVSGQDLRDARQSVDEFNRPAVAFILKPDAGARFGAFTERHINRLLATVLDGRVMSVATIESRIDDQGQIRGISREEMIQQVINLKSGALPADLEYVEEHTVGAGLGEASIRSGVLASIGGLALVALFMLAYYRLTGLNALVSIVLNLLILVGLVAFIPVTMTLPGIAGLILTIGMGVDSNVLIFERIKEELARARGARAAVNAGFDRVWVTIVDTHVTSLIAAALLFQFGTSPIRGFATTLTIGLLANVFTAVFVSRTLFEFILWRRGPAGQPLSISSPSRVFTNTSVDFSRWGRHAIVLSLVIIGAGVATIATRGLPLGSDFAGGTAVVVEFARQGITEDVVRDAVAGLPGDEVVQRYGPAQDRQFLIRLPLADAPDQSGSLEAGARQVTQALQAAKVPSFEIVDRQLVSAAIGDDLQQRGIYATVASILAITTYIGIRFRFAFAIGGIAATLHDILVTLACLSLAGYDLTLNVTAALLTIIGYSVNDTIVIFDRVRENVKAMRGDSLAAVVNLSVNQTLSRTVITAGATLLSVLSLYLFGGEALRGFAFTMLVGIVSGTYSTVFIASGIATRLGQIPHLVSNRVPQGSLRIP